MPALDGLRGWAVLAVMLYHFALPFVHQPSPGRAWWVSLRVMLTGSYGVDMFFVLSGFLITGILLDSKRSEGYFRTFYMRRLLRIFPLYYGVLAVCFGLLFWMQPFKQMVHKQLWLWLYGANFSDLAGVSLDPGFSHFWSLAVEEHFYLAWPIVVLALSRRRLMIVCAVMAILSPLMRCALIARGSLDADIAALLTPLRLEGLAMGGLLACIWRGRCELSAYRKLAVLLIVAGSLSTVALRALFGSASQTAWGLSGAGHFTICLTVAGILILAVVGDGLWSALLSMSWLRFLGKYSYGLYVYHYLLQTWIDGRFWFVDGIPALSLLVHVACAIAVTLGVSLLSWHLYEKQFLKLKKQFEYTRQSAVKAGQLAGTFQSKAA